MAITWIYARNLPNLVTLPRRNETRSRPVRKFPIHEPVNRVLSPRHHLDQLTGLDVRTVRIATRRGNPRRHLVVSREKVSVMAFVITLFFPSTRNGTFASNFSSRHERRVGCNCGLVFSSLESSLLEFPIVETKSQTCKQKYTRDT